MVNLLFILISIVTAVKVLEFSGKKTLVLGKTINKLNNKSNIESISLKWRCQFLEDIYGMFIYFEFACNTSCIRISRESSLASISRKHINVIIKSKNLNFIY